MQNIHNSIQIVTLSEIATSTTNKEFQRTFFNLNRPLVNDFINAKIVPSIKLTLFGYLVCINDLNKH